MSLATRNRARLLAWTGFILGFASLLSMLALGVFDYAWWAPLKQGDGMPRGFILAMSHVFLFAGGVVGAMYIIARWVNDDD